MKPRGAARARVLFLAAALIGAAVGITLDRAAAQQASIKRTILLRADDPGSPAYEAVMGIAELEPGATSGNHIHHGTEIGYVLEGSVVLEYPGQPSKTLKTGETFNNTGPHVARNGSAKPVKILAVYLVEKGKPLAEPAP